MPQLIEFTLFYAAMPMFSASLRGVLTGKSQIQSRLMSESLMKVNAGATKTCEVFADHAKTLGMNAFQEAVKAAVFVNFMPYEGA